MLKGTYRQNDKIYNSLFLLSGIAMETTIAKWIMETHELDDHGILLTLQIEDDTTIGVSTQKKEIEEMMKMFTKHNHVYQLTGFDKHKYYVSIT